MLAQMKIVILYSFHGVTYKSINLFAQVIFVNFISFLFVDPLPFTFS